MSARSFHVATRANSRVTLTAVCVVANESK